MNPNIQKHNAETHISEWFRTSEHDGIRPFEYVEFVVNEFCTTIEKKGFYFDISRQNILYDMCTAICTQYYYDVYHHKKYNVGLPKRKFTKPKQWNHTLDHQWNDYVHSRIINYEYWMVFWKRLPIAEWEQFISFDWRSLLQTLLPFYIQRELDVLIDEEIVCVEDDGNIVTRDDHESDYEETDVRNIDEKKKKK
jgi:hypothetical protein